MRDPDLRDAYEERAGIVEYDAGLPRHRAESVAVIMTRNWAQANVNRQQMRDCAKAQKSLRR